jgi:hypothetical protein
VGPATAAASVTATASLRAKMPSAKGPHLLWGRKL